MVQEPRIPVNSDRCAVGIVSGLPADGKLVYTVREVAQFLGVGRDQMYETVNAGNFPGYRVGRRWVIPRAAFERWLAGEWQPPITVTPIRSIAGRRAS